MQQIRIGTMVQASTGTDVIPQIIGHGFESFSLVFARSTSKFDLPELAKQVREVLANSDVTISSLFFFGNPLGGGEEHEEARHGWEELIAHAPAFGTDLVTGFAGRVPGQAIDDCMPRFKEVFGDLAQRAEDNGVRIGFENCQMDGDWKSGDWNIAHHPSAWELMFDAVPSPHLGLQWEPCHQLVALIDPIAQLRKWVDKIFNVHGKDATVAWDIIREYGIDGPRKFVWHRTPGFGDTNWTDVISILRMAGYGGTIDIEGWHDPVYRGDWEMTGQVYALNYLKQCRGGTFVPNPQT